MNNKYKIIILLFFLIFVLLLFVLFRTKNKIEGFDTIPKVVYQSWWTKDLPIKMKENVELLKKNNPEYEYKLYDDADCRKFIQDNYDEKVVNAFDSLIPGTFKGDLWRYCVLYKKGGIYLDIKYNCIDNIKLSDFIKDDELFVKEYDNGGWEYINNNPQINKTAVYTGLMVSRPNNEKYLKMINSICDNVKNKFYGNVNTEPTGPVLFRKFFTEEEFNKINYSYFESEGIGYIRDIKSKKDILKHYSEYRDEQKKFAKTKYWKELWNERNIYK